MHPCAKGAFNLSLRCRVLRCSKGGVLVMMSDLISLLVDEAALFQTSSARDAVPWSALSWGFLVPLVFTLNVAVAILAWFIVELFAKLM
jgi:hypothetical protein